MGRGFISLVVCLAAGCGGTQSGSAATTSLAGTWEVVGSRNGDVQKSALVTMSAESLVVVAWKGTFNAVLHGNTFDVSYSGSGHFDFGATRADGSGSAGIIPLPFFGEWDAHASNTPGCALSVKPELMTASCTKVSELPDWMENGGVATLQATRVKTLASDFGDFGGEWTFTTAVGASCSIRVEGTTISAVCSNAGDATGSASLVLDGDSGHGSTSSGIEFAAQRR